MDIWDANKITIFIAFAIPGFISLKTYELLSPSSPKEGDKQLIDAVTYSSVNYALLLLPIYEVETRGLRSYSPTLYAIFYVLVLLVAPVVWAFLLRKLRTTQVIQNSLPHPTDKPWDYVFSQRKQYWVIVTLKDGTRIGGRYGTNSFASSSPAPNQLYIEEAWNLMSGDTGGFEKARAESSGILILSDDIMTVEFFNFKLE